MRRVCALLSDSDCIAGPGSGQSCEVLSKLPRRLRFESGIAGIRSTLTAPREAADTPHATQHPGPAPHPSKAYCAV